MQWIKIVTHRTIRQTVAAILSCSMAAPSAFALQQLERDTLRAGATHGTQAEGALQADAARRP